MFRQCGQGLCREERQGCYNKDNSKSHDSKGHRIGFQRTSTFRNVSFLSQKSGQSYLADNRNETAQDQYNATGKFQNQVLSPKPSNPDPLLAAQEVNS